MLNIVDLFCHTETSKQLLESSRMRLYRVAFSWCHNAALADDLVQETLVKAYKKADQLRDPEAGQSWLFSILHNCYKDHFRRARETESIDHHELVEHSTPESESGELQIVAKVRHAIGHLPEAHRQVVTLVDLEGFSYIEVAEILDIPIGTVMSRLCRARGTLKDKLLDEFKNDPGLQAVMLRRVK